eukprot:superscaffoldBa00011143_g25073
MTSLHSQSSPASPPSQPRVMTEQQPHHDGAPVPMTTPVRWRGERWRDMGKERRDGERDRQKNKDNLLTSPLRCRSSAK